MSKRSVTVLWIREHALYLAWFVSLIAVLGSLFFSEIMGFVPCELCWYQRIFMYPLALLLGIASFKGSPAIVPYALPLSIIGGLIALYHYLQQNIPWLAQQTPCTQGVPCDLTYINWLGFITIPFLSLLAFILITGLLWLGREKTTM